MQKLTQIIAEAISGMFTKNIVDEVVQRIAQVIEREYGGSDSHCPQKSGLKKRET